MLEGLKDGRIEGLNNRRQVIQSLVLSPQSSVYILLS